MSQLNKSTLLPLFDSLEFIESQTMPAYLAASQKQDFNYSMAFLKSYTGSKGTFNGYRREVERLLQWCWHIQNKTLPQLKKDDIEAFFNFCQNPPKEWISCKKPVKFLHKEHARSPNPAWRPFVATLSKAEHRKGNKVSIDHYQLSQAALREMMAILSSFFNYLIQEEYMTINPVGLIRQKSQFIRKQQGAPKIRRLSELQWQYVIDTAEIMATHEPNKHERSLFIMSALYSMYLRISELCASGRWTPLMNDFYRDSEGNWWYTTVGKGNKQRDIAVSQSMLGALKRWRAFLNLTALPTPADSSPLIPKLRGKGPISNTQHIREIVQTCFDYAIERLQADNHSEEADSLLDATVHWLRHTGISDDVKTRPREHVRDDAGHSSSSVTDKYIDIELRARHASAQTKAIKRNE